MNDLGKNLLLWVVVAAVLMVVFQRAVHFGDQGVGDALAAHLEHGLEIVGLAAQEADLGIGKGGRHGVGAHWT